VSVIFLDTDFTNDCSTLENRYIYDEVSESPDEGGAWLAFGFVCAAAGAFVAIVAYGAWRALA
jgi:hypothetical protein